MQHSNRGQPFQFSDQEKKIREKINLTLPPTLSLMVQARIIILRKDACIQIVNLSICISCMCDVKLVKVILIWKTKTIKIQAVQINRQVSQVKSTIKHYLGWLFPLHDTSTTIARSRFYFLIIKAFFLLDLRLRLSIGNEIIKLFTFKNKSIQPEKFPAVHFIKPRSR